MSFGRRLLTLALAFTMVFSAFAVIAPLTVSAQVPPCGTVLVANTTIIGGLCATPFAYQVGAPGITIRCAAANPTLTGVASNVGIVNPGFANVVITGCTFKGFATGVEIVGATGNKILKNTAQNDAWGFNITTSTSTQVVRNKAVSNNRTGFNFVSSSLGQIVGNMALSNFGNGFAFTSDTHDVIDVNTAVLNGINGIDLISSTACFLLGNTALANGNDGILLTAGVLSSSGNLAPSVGNIVYHNVANTNHHDGIELTDANANLVIDNTAKFNQKDGIDLNGGSGVAGPNTMVQNITVNNLVFNRSDASVGADSDGTSNWWVVDIAVPPATTFPPPYLP